MSFKFRISPPQVVKSLRQPSMCRHSAMCGALIIVFMTPPPNGKRLLICLTSLAMSDQYQSQVLFLIAVFGWTLRGWLDLKGMVGP